MCREGRVAAWEGGGASESVVAWVSGRELATLWRKEGTGTVVGSGRLWAIRRRGSGHVCAE